MGTQAFTSRRRSRKSITETAASSTAILLLLYKLVGDFYGVGLLLQNQLG